MLGREERDPSAQGMPHQRQTIQAEFVDQPQDEFGLVRGPVLGIGRFWCGSEALVVDAEYATSIRQLRSPIAPGEGRRAEAVQHHERGATIDAPGYLRHVQGQVDVERAT